MGHSLPALFDQCKHLLLASILVSEIVGEAEVLVFNILKRYQERLKVLSVNFSLNLDDIIKTSKPLFFWLGLNFIKQQHRLHLIVNSNGLLLIFDVDN
jgi:hypothetical protein